MRSVIKYGWSTLIVNMSVVEDSGVVGGVGGGVKNKGAAVVPETVDNMPIILLILKNKNAVRMKLNTRTEDNVVSQIRWFWVVSSHGRLSR